MNSSIIEGFPHYDIEVEDNTARDVFQSEFAPISKQLYFVKAQKGIPFEPVWCETYDVAKKVFGAGTFDVTDKVYSSQASYFATEVFKNNGAFICRMAPYGPLVPETVNKAKCSFMILELRYHTVANFGEAKDQEGTELYWNVRTTLQDDETIDKLNILKPYVYKDPISAIEWNVVPIAAFKSETPGLFGDNTGFQFYYNSAANEKGLVDDVFESLLLSFAPVQKPTDSTNLVPIRTHSYNPSVNFTIKPDVYDKTTMAYISAKNVISDKYDGEFTLPYECFWYGENWKAVGDAGLVFENPVRTEPIKDGYLVNLFSLKDLDTDKYTRIRFLKSTDTGPNSAAMLMGVSHKLSAGDNGDIDDTTIESLIIDFCHFDLNPRVRNVPKYPITHLTDPGYHIETKKAMIDFQVERREVKTILSTQQVTDAKFEGIGKNTPNTVDEDESIGTALRQYALLHRESVIKGTEACRTTIFMQCGRPVDTNYDGYLPATLWATKKRAEYQNRDFMDKEPIMLPNSEINLFRVINWEPDAPTTKRRSWNAGLNYFQAYDMTRYHYASVRSVYPYETSVLVDDSFTDAIVFTKYKIGEVWAIYAGSKLPTGVLHDRIDTALTNALNALYNAKFDFEVDVYQTATEKLLGFVHHVKVTIYDDTSARVWEVDIVCERSRDTESSS